MHLRDREGGYRLRFDNGISVQILREGDVFRGLGEVKLRRRKLRSPELPIMPLVETPDGYRVGELRFREVTQGQESITIDLTPYVRRCGRMEWLCCDGQDRWHVGPWEREPARDRGGVFRLRLRAVNRSIGDVTFVGFSYAYKFRSRKHRIYRMHDRATWELGGWATGNSFWMQGPFNSPQKTFKNKKDRYTTSWCRAAGRGVQLQQFLPLFSALQGFTFQFDQRSLLVTVFEEPFACRSLFQKDPGQNYLIHWHQLCGDLAGCVEFPALQVLCAEGPVGDPAERANQYCAVREELHRQFTEHYGLTREGMVTSGRIVADGDLRADDLKRGLAELARAACERVYVPALMRGVGPRLRSRRADATKWRQEARERIARFVDQAHQRGMEVAVPLGDCCRPWLRPDAGGKGAEDEAEGDALSGGDSLVALALRDPEARKDLLDHLRHVRANLGIDAVFSNSVLDGIADPFEWTSSSGRPGQDAAAHPRAFDLTGREGHIQSLDRQRVELIAELQRMGYRCVLAGVGGLASTEAVPSFDAVYGKEYMFRDCVLSFPGAQVAESGVDPLEAYFRGCANRAGYATVYNAGTEGRASTKWWQQEYAAANKAYHAVREYMERSRLLLKDRGVLWTGPDPEVQVLWAYKEFPWRVGSEAEVFDVMASTPVEAPSGTFTARPGRVYLVQNAALP